MEKKKFSVKLDTVLKLPNEVVTCRSGNDFVVISPKDGNWLVLSEEELKIFEQLRLGKTVGEVVSKADKRSCLILLKQIVARNFTERVLSVVDRNARAMFYLTYDCNLKCGHCYMFSQRRRADMLSVGEYRSIFATLKQYGVKEVTFSGGEPLMRSDFWDIIQEACDVGLIPKVFSNGTLWGDADIERAKAFAVKVQISIDGVDETSCAAVRGAHVFEKAKDVAVKLAKAGVDVEIATTPILENMEEIEHGYSAFVKDLQEKAGGKIRFKVTLSLLPGRNLSAMSPDEKKDYEQRGIRLYSISNPGGSHIPFFEEYRKGIGRIVCGLGRLAFSPDGFVYVCSQLDFLPAIGNVREVGVVQLLEEAKKRITAASVDNTIPCRECPLRHICGGGCRAERYQYVSDSENVPSVHKPCTEKYKQKLLQMMVQTTKECYTWE